MVVSPNGKQNLPTLTMDIRWLMIITIKTEKGQLRKKSFFFLFLPKSSLIDGSKYASAC